MEVSETNDLYLFMQNNVVSWLAPDTSGVATTLNPQPQIFPAALMHSTLEQSLMAARLQLESEHCWLLALTDCPDGPPYRSAFLFIPRGECHFAWQDGPYMRRGKKGRLYRRATRVTSLGSDGEGYGFFLTGSGDGSLWRLFRPEIDLLNRWVLTLSPVTLSARCPQADFSELKTPLLAASVGAQYADLARSITTKSYLAVVTDAKNIVEGIVAEKLGTTGKSRNLAEDLQSVKKLLEKNPRDGSCAWTFLEYHLAQKIRLVHGQTHATAPVKSGRPLRPEFALSTVEDLVELLYLWGYCKV